MYLRRNRVCPHASLDLEEMGLAGLEILLEIAIGDAATESQSEHDDAALEKRHGGFFSCSNTIGVVDQEDTGRNGRRQKSKSPKPFLLSL